jgi:hypothetical protein
MLRLSIDALKRVPLSYLPAAFDAVAAQCATAPPEHTTLS